MIVYKIVNKDLCSCRASYWHNKSRFSIQYKIGEFVSPPIGKIFAFNSLENALLFASKHGFEDHIYTAETNNAVSAEYISLFSKGVDDFWLNINNHLCVKEPAPDGTLFCDDLKLLEKVGV